MKKDILIDKDKKELTMYLLPNFPIGIMESNFSNITYNSVDWHWHDEFQFTVVTKGEFLFTIGKEKIKLKEGEVLFINTQKIHNSIALKENSSYLFVYFHPNLIPSDKHSYIFKKFIAPISKNVSLSAIKFLKEEKIIYNIIINLKKISEHKNFAFELELLINLIELWKYTVLFLEKHIENENIIFSENDPLFNERLKKIITYIDENYNDKFELERISNLINLSHSECCRFFKKATNQTLGEFLLNYRINKALYELLNTDKTISEIAYDNGFSSQSYFCKKFKEIKKISPNKIRKIKKI